MNSPAPPPAPDTPPAHTGQGPVTVPPAGHAPAPPPVAAASAPPAAVSSGFTRLWRTFMSARVLLALAILGLYLGLHMLGRPQPLRLLLLYLAYGALTLLVRLLATPRGPGRSFDPQWPITAGVDLLFFIGLHTLGAGMNYTPMLVLPVLMVAVLGSRALALGTAALVTLILLGQAAWLARDALVAGADEIAQAGLVSGGLLLLALLTNQLSLWLAREEVAARRSQAEAQIQALVSNMVIEALPDGVLVVDARNLVRSANPAALLMLGSEMEVTPHLFSLEDHPAWTQLAHVAQLTFRDGPVDSTEVTLHHEDRHSSHLQVRTQRTPAIDGGGRGLCVMFLQDLREMEARLRTEKLAAMGRMSAAVAHEIRNPLAAISQANALLAEELQDPAQQRLTAMVAQNAQRLGHIVDDVLNIARVQDSGEPEAAHILELEENVSLFCQEWGQQHAAGKRLLLELHAPDVHVQFARDHLRRILVNLLDNAARYATRRGGAIQVATHAVRHGPVMLLVWSDGPPMEPTVRRHLFEPFFSSESRSSGLGLFICRELCERHGASIGYERTAREQDGQIVEGNEFFISFRRMHGGQSILHTHPATP